MSRTISLVIAFWLHDLKQQSHYTTVARASASLAPSLLAEEEGGDELDMTSEY